MADSPSTDRPTAQAAMERVQIRELLPSDLDSISDLIGTRDELDDDGVRKRTRLLEWLAFHNPFAEDKATYFVAEDAGRIVAHLGRMPTELVVHGTTVPAYYIHDLYVHTDYRKMGLGYFLSSSLYDAAEEGSDSLCGLTGMTGLNLGILRRRGYEEMSCERYARMIHPRAIAKAVRSKALFGVLSPFLRAGITILDSLLRTLTPARNVVQLGRADARFDELMDRIRDKICISTFKSSEYLNWRHVDRPYNDTAIFAVEQGDGIAGFVLVGCSFDEQHPCGNIIDMIADPDDVATIASLCATVIRHFKRKGVDTIYCRMTDQRFVKVMKRFLFFKARTSEIVMLTNLSKCGEEPQYLKDPRNWHLTYNESDGFMLEPQIG